ncbi:MAG TPA: hypothetical protein VN363_07820 [Anaerolineales bacterium]|nr:hypothetical protein [Anaerolineales bacterium]
MLSTVSYSSKVVVKKIARQVPFWLVLISLVGCNMPGFILAQPTEDPMANTPLEGIPTAEPLPPPQQTEVTFRVSVPANSPTDQPVYLVILDEVTGLALNAVSHTMEEESGASPEGKRQYSLSLPFPLGAAVTYRYERGSTAATVGEHITDGRPVRYRIYHVTGPGLVDDVVSRWTDTEFSGATGRIMGQAKDIESGLGIPHLLIAAGGAQTLTASDGSFILEGLPAGVHNLVAYSLEGAYVTFQQGALVAADSTTPAPLEMRRPDTASVIFVVSVPEGTPPAVPVRLAGNLSQLGNTFANLAGGVSTVADRMPVMEPLPDGRYTVSLELPVGAYLSYKYTLGDGFWNAEHAAGGGFSLHHVVVPEGSILVEDTVETWATGGRGAITFDITVPANTPTSDSVAIQFNPFYGWTEPIPMWKLTETRWVYILYSPLNLVGDLAYRICRDSQCSAADDLATTGATAAGKKVTLSGEAQKIVDSVAGWAQWGAELPQVGPVEGVKARDPFIAGVEFQAGYHPSWQARLPAALDDTRSMGSNWVMFSPTWTYTRNSLPILEPVAGQDATWFDMVAAIEHARLRGLQVALFPQPAFTQDVDSWWQTAPRDFGWWLVWFEQYRLFILHHADLAQRMEVPALVMGGEWLLPAVQIGSLADGSPSGVPADAEQRWRNLIAEVRSRYSGTLLWASPYGLAPHDSLASVPQFADAVDVLYILFSPPLSLIDTPTAEEIAGEAGRLMDLNVNPVLNRFNKPVILGVEYASADGGGSYCINDGQDGCADPDSLLPTLPDQPGVTLDLQEQAVVYSGVMAALHSRPWISGVFARGYYPAAPLQDKSASVHGKPAQSVLESWFTAWIPVVEPAPPGN